MSLQANSPKTIFLVDSALRDFVYHFYHFDLAVYEAFKEREKDVRVFACQDIIDEVGNSMSAQKVFKNWVFNVQTTPAADLNPTGRVIYDSITSTVDYFADITKAFKENPCEQAAIFVPIINHRQLLAWSWALETFLEKIPTSLLLLWPPHRYTQTGNPLNEPQAYSFAKFTLSELERVKKPHHFVQIASDNRSQGEELSKMTTLPVCVTPCSRTYPSDIKMDAPLGRKPIVSYLGGARLDKGFDVFAKALVHLADHSIMNEVDFYLQCHIGPSLHATVSPFVEMVEKLNKPNIRIYKMPLANKAYRALLERTSMAVLPYRTDAYGTRTSGCLSEVLGWGIPALVTGGTWLSEQLKDYGIGATFKDGDPHDLAEQLIKITPNLIEFRKQAYEGRHRWIEAIHPRHYAQTLLEPFK